MKALTIKSISALSFRNLKIALIILSLIAISWLQIPRLIDEYQVEEDFRSFYWMNKFQDSDIFPVDQLSGHVYSVVNLPWGTIPVYFKSLGYGLLFYLASFFISPILFSKLLPFVLMPVTVGYLFAYGRAVSGKKAAVLFSVMFIFINLASSTSLSVATGLQRSFAFPLVIAALYYLLQEREIEVFITSFAAVLIYPPMFLLIIGMWGLSTLEFRHRPVLQVQIARRRLGYVVAAFLLGALVVLPVLLPNVGQSLTPDETLDISTGMDNNPNRVLGGRAELFYLFPVVGRGGLFSKAVDAIYVLLLFILSLFSVIVLGTREVKCIPHELKLMVWSSLLIFVLDWVLLLSIGNFLLYLPSRYTRVGLMLFFMLFVGLNIPATLVAAHAYVRRYPHVLRGIVLGVVVMLVLFVLLYPTEKAIVFGVNFKWLLLGGAILFGIFGFYVAGKKSVETGISKSGEGEAESKALWLFCGVLLFVLVFWGWYVRQAGAVTYLNPSEDERALFRYLRTLPKDVLIGGTPSALDSVPLFSAREILFSYEKLSQDANLIREALLAYYAEDVETLVDFCVAQGVSHLIVDIRYYDRNYIEQGIIFFEPYNDQVISEIQQNTSFVVMQVDDDAKVFESGPYYVIPCDERFGLTELE